MQRMPRGVMSIRKLPHSDEEALCYGAPVTWTKLRSLDSSHDVFRICRIDEEAEEGHLTGKIMETAEGWHVSDWLTGG